MKLYRIFLASSVLLLIIQLISIEVHLPIQNFAYGDFKERVKEKVVYVSSVIQGTKYSSVQKTEYDSLVFVGDIMLARNVEFLMDANDTAYPYEGLQLETLGQNPAIIGNFEASMATPHVMTPAYQMKFSVRSDTLPELKNAGFTYLSLANNHSLDYGADGYQSAATQLLENGFVIFGHGTRIDSTSISYLDSPRGTIALVGINASAEIPSRSSIESVLKEATKNSELQIVYIHWGVEYDVTHSKTQKLMSKELVAAGADLIVGHHPHVVQDIDIVDGVIVFYSLGNYIFDQYFSEDVKEGLVLSLNLEDGAGVYLVPVESKNPLSQPRLMGPDNHAIFLKNLAERSNPSLKNSIEKGYIPLGDAVATSSKMAIIMR
jgi:gamma-polyglutamate biosynthesis protein CapA